MNNFSVFDTQVIDQVSSNFPIEEKAKFWFFVIRKSVRDYPQKVRELLKNSAGIVSGVSRKELTQNLIHAIFNVPGFVLQYAKMLAEISVKREAKYANWIPTVIEQAASGNPDPTTGAAPAPPDPAQKDVWDKVWGTVDRISSIGLQVGGWFMNRNGSGTTTPDTAQQQFTDEYNQFDQQQGAGVDVMNIVKWVLLAAVTIAVLFFGGRALYKAIKK